MAKKSKPEPLTVITLSIYPESSDVTIEGFDKVPMRRINQAFDLMYMEYGRLKQQAVQAARAKQKELENTDG